MSRPDDSRVMAMSARRGQGPCRSRPGRRRVGALLAVGALLGLATGRAADGGLYRTPAVSGLVDALTFHLSFDAASFVPDLAAGDAYAATEHLPDGAGGPQFAPGVSGRALVLGSGAALFPSAGNVPFGRCGALAFWIEPLDWRRPNSDNTEFVMTADSLFYLQRQGPLQDADGRLVREECFQYLAKAGPDDRQYTCLTDGLWENGRWYFVVANWAWPQMQLSVDGGPFAAQTLPARPGAGLYGAFIVGSAHGDRGLLDEVMAFSRPLSLDEIRALMQATRNAAR